MKALKSRILALGGHFGAVSGAGAHRVEVFNRFPGPYCFFCLRAYYLCRKTNNKVCWREGAVILRLAMLSSDRGITAVTFAISMLLLMALAAVAVDGSNDGARCRGGGWVESLSGAGRCAERR